VNINQRRLEVYREPLNPTGNDDGWRYASVTHHGPGETVSMLKRPAVKLAVDKMLP
jgi:hypothetical protein